MTKPGSDPTNGPAPTPRPRTPALVRGGVAALALGIAGCGAGDAQPPQSVPPQALPIDTAVVPPQAPPPPDLTAAPPPPQVAPPQIPPPPSPKNNGSPPPNAR